MMDPGTVLALVTARGGSKGLPRKNILTLAGHPMIAWTLRAALDSPSVSRVIVSTDDDEIASVARTYGCEVPFLRPAELSGDDAPHIDVVMHGVTWLIDENDWRPDWVLLLQPTSPARNSADVEGAICLALTRDVDAVVGVCGAPSHPFLVKSLSDEGYLQDFIKTPQGYLRRQDLPPAYYVNGAIYLVRTETLLKERTLFPARTIPYEMPAERSLDVDSEWDFRIANYVLSRRSENIDPK